MQHLVLKNIPVDKVATLFCFTFGCLLLIFVVSPGDGGWILYGHEIGAGKKIYTDLHMNQQPLFPLISAAITFVTNNILYQHLLYAPILLLFCFSIYRIAAVFETNIYFRAAIILAVFFLSIRFEAYRFDDYHALAQSLVLLSFGLSADAIIKPSKNFYKFFLVQGFIFGLAFITRVNDGLAISMGVATAGFVLTRNAISFFKGLMLFLLTGTLVILLGLLLIGETPAIWFDQTINRAVGNKGGAAVFFYPIKLFVNSFEFLRGGFDVVMSSPYWTFVIGYGGLAFAVFIFSRSGTLKNLVLLSFLFGLTLFAYKIGVTFASLLTPVVVILVFLSFSISLAYTVCTKNLKAPKLFAILAYPFAIFCFGSLSSGGRFQDLTFPAAAFMAVFPICLMLINLKGDAPKILRFCMLVVFVILFAEGLYQRSRLPFAWHSYNVPPLFSSEYKSDDDYVFGPLLLSTQVSSLIKPVCHIVTDGKTLLSLPFSFANYYCDIPVWNGYVQSFFDTAGPILVDGMLDQLQRNPPDYIFYQRQVLNLTVHEALFNDGRPLPHRKLDEFIMGKINAGKWAVVYRSDLYPPSDWLLIKTKN